MTFVAKNIFIVGDLVIDHSVFVREALGEHQGIDAEPIYEVVRRMDTAGGAANCARILAVLNSGHTVLWGLTGKSNWGDFRSILENCQAIDGATSNIEFRGVQDETQAKMNTITRLILLEGTPQNFDYPVHKLRFDDYGHVHIPEDKRNSLLHYLARAHEKYTIDGIIINDLGMNCLTADLVKRIATFANTPTGTSKDRIPLFIDPKRDRSKYLDIEGTAIFPNLEEWCYLVDQDKHKVKWRERLDREESLEEMAQLSFRYLGNFRYHIIKCDELGSVILAPHSQKDDKYAVYRVPPHKTRKITASHQLGCGDVLTAIFALEFSGSDQTTDAALQAFSKANVAVSCYRDMPWHRMPSRESISEAQRKLIKPSMVAQPSKGMLFLPKETAIELSEHETLVTGLFSVDSVFISRVETLINDIQNEWKGKLKSIILGAPSGCGKSTILSELKAILGNRLEIKVDDLTGLTTVDWNNLDAFFEKLSQEKGGSTGKLLAVVDEALKGAAGRRLKKYGVMMLNSAHKYNVRFLFIDALFRQGRKPSITSEITSRCSFHYLSGLAERPKDIPYIVAALVFANHTGQSFNSVKIEGKYLLAITNAILSNPNPRILCNWIDKSCAAALKEHRGRASLKLLFRHLPRNERSWSKLSTDNVAEEYKFYRAQ